MAMEIDYGEIEEILRQITGESVGFGELVEDATNGGSLLSLQHWIKTLGNNHFANSADLPFNSIQAVN